jgi:hypothetical protein
MKPSITVICMWFVQAGFDVNGTNIGIRKARGGVVGMQGVHMVADASLDPDLNQGPQGTYTDGVQFYHSYPSCV